MITLVLLAGIIGGLWSGFNNEITTAPDGLILESVANGLPIIHVGLNYRLNSTFPIFLDIFCDYGLSQVQFLASLHQMH